MKYDNNQFTDSEEVFGKKVHRHMEILRSFFSKSNAGFSAGDFGAYIINVDYYVL